MYYAREEKEWNDRDEIYEELLLVEISEEIWKKKEINPTQELILICLYRLTIFHLINIPKKGNKSNRIKSIF